MRRGWSYVCAFLALVIAVSPASAAAQGTGSMAGRPAGEEPIWVRLLGSPLAAALVAALVSWGVSVWVTRRQVRASLEAANVSADATREAGLKHAIETEALKLRYAIGRRHVDAFYNMAGPLHAILMELPHADDAKVKSFHNHMYPNVPLNVVLYAEMATPPGIYDRAYSIEKTFIDAVHALMNRLRIADPNPDARPRAEAEEIADLSIVSVTALLYLMRVVDLSNQIRASASGAAPTTAEFNAMLKRWEETRQTLPIVPPDSSGIAGMGPSND